MEINDDVEKYCRTIVDRRLKHRTKGGRRRLDYQPPKLFSREVLTVGGILGIIMGLFALLMGD